ncbi:hypothetical protein Tco_1006830 [Tanacetum coccineum]|uniref:Uncharacterized protein n=1 Tax=Tanacetum coccineum TaxID=301880 RepID=A0ABQ5FKR1_9ASTR
MGGRTKKSSSKVQGFFDTPRGISRIIKVFGKVKFTNFLLDTSYWFDPIRRIEFESTSIVVKIDLTWSLEFVSVELGRLPNPLSCSTLLICISKVLIDAPWFLIAAFVKAQISLIKLELSSCLFSDSLMNLLRVSSIDCFRSWNEGLTLFL